MKTDDTCASTHSWVFQFVVHRDSESVSLVRCNERTRIASRQSISVISVA